MKNIYLYVFGIFFLIGFFVVSHIVKAEITYPYTVDEKDQVIFSDTVEIISVSTSIDGVVSTTTYKGLENYTQDYVGGFVHFTFTYTHSGCCYGAPPLIYVTDIDPRTTSTPTEKNLAPVYTLTSVWSEPTDWYLYDIQFDETGYAMTVKRAGNIEIYDEHYEVTGQLNSDWVSLANRHHKIEGTPSPPSMSFTPVPIKEVSEQTINPVIIIPGIMGSAYKNGERMIDPVFHVYDNLIETLENNGYVKEKNLFPWGYDWKKSNVETGQLLKQKIDDIKTTCLVAVLPDIDCNKVDIIAHSMGGFVARVYAQSSDYDNDIDQLIFLGTPHKGSPKDYLVWEAGEFLDGTIDRFIESHFKKEAKRLGYNNLFDYIHGWPITSVKELLPTYDYLKDADSNQLLNYSTGYPENNFLENLNQGLVSFLESDIEITNIIGNTGVNTISLIRITDEDKLPLWEHGYPEGYDNVFGDKGLETGVGDGTVPEYSSKFGNPDDLEIINSSHTNLPTDVEEEIYEIIHGGELINTVKTSLPLKILFAKIFSPVDFVIIDPNGKRIGKDFATGQEINEIPGAFYSGFDTDDEYITIPDPLDGEYKVLLQGTGEGGFYDFEITYISDNMSVTSETSGITEPDHITKITANLDNNNPDELEIERTVTLDVVITDINGAYNLGWIKDAKTRDKLLRQAKLIIKLENKRSGKQEQKVDKLIVKLLKRELDLLLKRGKINQRAYDLLKTDLEYLINNN